MVHYDADLQDAEIQPPELNLNSPLGIKLKYVSVVNTSVHSAFKPCMALGSKFSFIPSIQYLDLSCLDIMVLLAMRVYGTCICVCQLTLCFKPFYLGENSSWRNSTSKEEL